MKAITRVFHFLGSFYFAIFLLASTALYVIAGTFIESWTGSHRYAEQWTYSHPTFQLLLAGYFINILLSALRRWPFKKRHIPFLITHLGLLMVITGVFIKSQKGVQGHLMVWEGGSSSEILLPNTYALKYDRKGEKTKSIPITMKPGTLHQISFHEWFRVLDCAEHCQESRVSFIKGDALTILGHPPLPLSQNLQPSGNVSGWDVYGLRSDHPLEQAVQIYESQWGKPSILFIEDPERDLHIYAFDEQGKVLQQKIQHNNLDRLIVYDNGFAGYATQLNLPTLDSPLEALLKPNPQSLPPSKKIEDNRPKIYVELMNKWGREHIELAYDPQAQGIRWPALRGQARVRFQPQTVEIPYRIRLRNARQISYPMSSQAASYEANLIVEDLRTGHSEEKLISMNQVHETWDGYRFYLSGIAPAQETDIRRVNLVVNYDPAKYWLTYPGGILVALGIVLLFSYKALGSKK